MDLCFSKSKNREWGLKMRASGFTLIEMMIVVVIVAILAAIAYPSYQQHVRKTRRAEAIATLNNVSQGLERCYTRFGAYQDAGGNCVSATAVSGGGFVASEGDWYRVTADVDIAAGAQTFAIRATPQGVQVDDTQCGEFTLNHAGQRGETGTLNVDDCW